MNKDVKRYIKDCKKILRFSNTYDKKFFSSFITQLEDYCKNNENSSYEELCNTYGTPKELAINTISDLDENILEKRLHSDILGSRIKICAIAIILLLLTSIVCLEVGTFIRASNTDTIEPNTTITSGDETWEVME